MACGITIGKKHYNSFVYAGDLLLCSLSVTGLQKMLDTAVFYKDSHGLHFNPTKTECMVYGRNPFKTTPVWTISGKHLAVKPSLTYLGTVLDGSVGPREGLHTESRIRASQKAYFSLQGSGFHKNGVSPQTQLSVYNAAVRTPLLYGCLSAKLSRTNLTSLDKQQAKQIKCMLGLNQNRSHTTPLLETLNTKNVSQTIFKQSLDLLRRSMLNNSNARSFYFFVLTNSENFIKNSLIGRLKEYSFQQNINLYRYIFFYSYRKNIKSSLSEKVQFGANGLTDSVRYLLNNYTKSKRKLLSLLLKSF